MKRSTKLILFIPLTLVAYGIEYKADVMEASKTQRDGD